VIHTGNADVIEAPGTADRLIYATAIEHGYRLVTKDEKLRSHRQPRPVALW
jgi:PIN domain nuclease of toxin-antitoxin system